MLRKLTGSQPYRACTASGTEGIAENCIPTLALAKHMGGDLHDAADHNTVGQHIVVVVAPLAGQPAR